MPQAVNRHDLEQMLAQGLSQREISKRTGMPRSTLQRLLKSPQVPEVIPVGRPEVAPGRPLPQSLVEAGPVLLEMAAWPSENEAVTSGNAVLKLLVLQGFL
jgi:predicted DNA-binding transcriptional regulator AlpA